MDPDPVLTFFLAASIIFGLVLSSLDLARMLRGKNIDRVVRPGFELAAHLSLIVFGIVGLVAYSPLVWLICGGIAFLLCMIAYHVTPPPPASPAAGPDDQTE